MVKTRTKAREINPSAISLELTHEQSVFYTIKKADYTLYFQHFLNDTEEDEDEAILTIFKKVINCRVM